MIIVLGASGHVGSVVADALLKTGSPITAVTRNEAKAAAWRDKGGEAAVVDVADVDRLRAIFRTGARAFLLNPPAAPATDTDKEERRTMTTIVAALAGSGLEKVVLQSTYGAQAGAHLGDLGVLHEFEQALASQPIPATVLQGAYYMSNWDALLPAAKAGTLPTMFPADLSIPMVAPADLGLAAARLLQEPGGGTGIHHVEGPERYTPQDVANAFAQALGRPVKLAVTPRDEWEAAFRQLGFSAEAAASYTRMTAVTVDGAYEMPKAPERGGTTLQHYVSTLVNSG